MQTTTTSGIHGNSVDWML